MIDTEYRKPDFAQLPRTRLESMRDSGQEVLECQRVLQRGGLNIVGEVLREQGTFYEMDHYPKGDVYDPDSHSQYYYHSHRSNQYEHGHFHTFLRSAGMPKGVAPAPYSGDEPWPLGDEALSHLISISMDKAGVAIGLFTVNRWVTGDTWYPAADVIRMLDLFVIDHDYTSWPTNRWISAMIGFYYPQIVELIKQRDRVVEDWAEMYPDLDVYEDRKLEITGFVKISDQEQIDATNSSLA
ncbi:MAG: hypothetical protein ACC663_04675 [Gammaproteobacteria bacterium]